MFDIGFLEIIVVVVVALIVIGPERMPEVARKIGQFMGKTKRFINTMKEDSEISAAIKELQNSINLDEEKKELEAVSESLHDDLTQLPKDWGIEGEISRPTFGGAEPANHTDSQFNKAPAQPEKPSQTKVTSASESKADISSAESNTVVTDKTDKPSQNADVQKSETTPQAEKA